MTDEGAPNNGPKLGFLEQMETEAMKSSLDARVAAEEQILTQLDEVFSEIDALIPQLPAIAGEPLTESEQHAQTEIRKRFEEYSRLTRLFLFEQTEAGGNTFETIWRLGETRYKALDILVSRGVMTNEDRHEWHLNQLARSERLGMAFQRMFDLQQAHMEQIMRKK